MASKFNVCVACALIATTIGVSAAVLPALNSVEVADFEDYKPPSRLDVIKYDYMDQSGNPSTTTTEYPTWQANFPYRAVLLGAKPTSNNGSQDHDCAIYVVYSKTPTLDFFSFTYMPGTKSSTQTGYIRADYTDGWDTMGRDKDWVIMSWSRTGVTSGSETVPLYSSANYPTVAGRKYFDFDFYYQCCGTLAIDGLRNITDVPYPYILTCTDLSGNGGGSESASSSSSSSGSGSGGSSSGGSSSGGGSSGDGSSDGDGSSSGGSDSSSSAPWEEDGSYPWEDDDNIPEFSSGPEPPPYVNEGEDGEGENGDTWELPTWGEPSLPFTDGDLNIPDFPVDLTEGYPDLPGGSDMAEGYPDPYAPSGTWPPPMPGPGS